MTPDTERQIQEQPRTQTGQDVINRSMAQGNVCHKCGTTGTQGEMTFGADPGYGGAV